MGDRISYVAPEELLARRKVDPTTFRHCPTCHTAGFLYMLDIRGSDDQWTKALGLHVGETAHVCCALYNALRERPTR